MWILLLVLLAPLASAQKVLSARSGMIYYSEGAVTVDGKALRASASDRRPQLRDGQIFTSVRGHAEILMGPGATLWTRPGTGVRFDNTSADQSEVTLLTGALVVEVHKPVEGTRLRVHIGDSQTDFSREGVYRFEAAPARIRVYAGEATLNGTKLLRGQEWTAGATREFPRKDRDEFLYFAAYRSLQLEIETGKFRLWHGTNFTEWTHAGFGIDFPDAPGSARVKYLTGGEAGLVYHLEGSAVTGGKSPVMTNRLPFRIGEENYLRTEAGKAEVFLGVGMVARLGENSQLRMMDTQATQPVIALDLGSASIEVSESTEEPHLRVRVGDSITELVKPGVYQFDAKAGSLRIYGGEATTVISDVTVRGRPAQQVSLREAGSATKFDTSLHDALFQWSADRSFLLYQSPAAFMTGWHTTAERGQVKHKSFGKRVDRRPQPRRRRPQL